MDNQRLLIWAFFGMMAWLTYQAWMQDYGPQPVAAPTAVTQPVAEQQDPGLPELEAADDTQIDAPSVLVPGAEPAMDVVAGGSPAIRVNTDVFGIEISTQGGTLQYAELQNYPVAKDRPDDLIKLLNAEAADIGLIQTGLRSAGDGPAFSSAY